MSTDSILVVDDTPANVKLLVDVLSARGYRTASAASGEAESTITALSATTAPLSTAEAGSSVLLQPRATQRRARFTTAMLPRPRASCSQGAAAS